jgi:Spy/CpxP family protein refolding chaperone
MKRELAILSAFLLLSVTACSQPGPAPGPGPGMMGGYGGMPPDLSPEQRTQLAEIQQEYRRKQWGVMQSMHSLMGSAEGPAPGGAFDEQAARKNYDAVAALRKQMFENSLEARKRMDALLTPQQREQMRRGWGAR